jgi:RimJ/RimL family protein N-acetyltransferase/esterase/lipase
VPYFDYNGKSIFYEERGCGKPLVLLHGNTASSKMFADVAGLFVEDFRVVFIDFLGHGQSERVKSLAVDLWFDEALQTIALLEHLNCSKVNLIGSSGGALVAINVALERPELVDKVIADSFEGDKPLKEVVQSITEEREASKQNENSRAFYLAMHGEDWECVVDCDAVAIKEHAKAIGRFFHKPLSELRPDILLVGSLEDEFTAAIEPDFYRLTFAEMLSQIRRGRMRLFDHGGHPAMLSNSEEFAQLAKTFLSPVILRTERLLLRPIVDQDAAAIFEYSKGANVGPNAGWKPHESIEETQEIMKDIFLNKDGVFGIVLLDSGTLIGSIGIITDPKRENDQTRMLGYAIGEEYWGCGYTTEAARAVIAHGFDELQLDLISAYCYPHNERSKNVLKKLGFQYEGTLSQCEKLYNGKIYDNDCYALMKGKK